MENQEERSIRNKETTSEMTVSETQAKTAVVSANSPVPSPTSSPSHEFSFTISLHSAATTTPTSPTLLPTKTKQQHHEPPLAIDLTPADDIFFHGHLLPLHFLSHLHASSPRSSTNSLDSFTLPRRDTKPTTNSLPQDRTTGRNTGNHSSQESQINKPTTTKPSSFSLSGLSKWIKGSDPKEKPDKKRQKFDVSQFIKRYIRMAKPLLSPKGGGRRDNNQFGGRGRGEHQSYSFSGSLSPRVNKKELSRDLRGQFSAPASMRTSPTNSGRLLAKAAAVASPVSDSTMEELQSAIQAAIAHCKKSSSSSSSSSSTSTCDDKSHDVTSPVPVN